MKDSTGRLAATLVGIAGAAALLAGTAGASPVLEEAKKKGTDSVEAQREAVNEVYRQIRGPLPEPGYTGRVIYGDDDRIEVWEELDPAIRAMADSAVVVVNTSELTNNGDGTFTLQTSPWTTAGFSTVCEDEPFRGQPQIGFCSGFLVGTDLIATAGHCISSPSGIAFVFGFQIDTDGGSAPQIVPADHVYFATQLVDRALSGGLDHAVVRVDRDVVGFDPVPIRREGTVQPGEPLVMIGHPVVIPKKIAGGAEVKNASGSTPWFQSNLDAYGGNSGSMVINLDTLLVEGILVRGAPDFINVRGCAESNRVPDSGNTGGGLVFEEVSKTSFFANSVPELGLGVSPAGTVTHVGVPGGPFTNDTVTYTLSNPTGDPLDYMVGLSEDVGILIDGGTSTIVGTLPGNGSTQVEVTLDPSVSALPAGVYTETIVFDDLSSGREITRTHVLEIGQTLVTVGPSTGLTSGGPVGGPFSGSQTYTVTSQRPTPVQVEVTASDPWISVDGSSSTIVSLSGTGDSAMVEVGYSIEAESLAAGFYTGSVTFTNLDNNDTTSRTVELDVGRFIYPSTDTPIDILDNSSFVSSIAVGDSFCVADVQVEIDITHTFRGDLIVELTSPSGTTVRLHNRTGGSADDIIGTYGIDLTPDGPGELADFIGEPSAGTWELFVSDNATLDQGTLNSWTLRLASSADPCPPVAQDGELTVEESYIAEATLAAISATGDPLVYRITERPDHGVLWDTSTTPPTPVLSTPFTLGGDTVAYRANIGYTGNDSFAFVAEDGVVSDPATVAVSVGGESPIHEFTFDTDPGWSTEGLWERGEPTGASSGPSSAFVGTNIYAYNLAGNYPDNLNPPEHLTTTALDLTGATSVRLEFRRWLRIESSTWDQARIQASTDGTTWSNVWIHDTGTLLESSWTLQSYDISAVADDEPTVYIRWAMGPTDASVNYAGWNIDDVKILGVVPGFDAGDFNRDGNKDIFDVLDYLNAFESGDPLADYTGTGDLNIFDILEFLNAFGD